MRARRSLVSGVVGVSAAALALTMIVGGASVGAGSGTVPAEAETPTPSPTATATATTSPSVTATPSPSATATPTPTPSSSATPSAAPSRPPAMATSWVRVVDTRRWTVSHGHVLAHSRTLRTLVLAPTVGGRHPLIIFCHGYDITPRPYLHMLEHWVSAGFVVAAPYFPLTQSGARRWLDENDVANQPRDVSVVLTALLRRYPGTIDRSRIIVAGHSDGGTTAFAVGFARRLADVRVTAIMAFSGSEWPGLHYRAPSRRLPLLLVQSDRDEFNPVRAANQLWSVAHRPKIYLHLHGARHLPPFASSCPWRPIVEAVTTDFLRAWTARTAATRTQNLNAADRDGTRTNRSRVTDAR